MNVSTICTCHLLRPIFLFFFFSMLRPPPISTLFPYTTLFRSHRVIWIYVVGMLALNVVIGVMALYFKDVYGVTEETIGYFFTDRKSTRLNSSHRCISYAVFCLKKKKKQKKQK